MVVSFVTKIIGPAVAGLPDLLLHLWLSTKTMNVLLLYNCNDIQQLQGKEIVVIGSAIQSVCNHKCLSAIKELLYF